MSMYTDRKITIKVTQELFEQIQAATITLPGYTAKTVSMFVRTAIRDKLKALEEDARLYKGKPLFPPTRELPTTRRQIVG
jgi:hypothetical protein